MDNSVLIALGIPEHGWLPVEIHHRDFHLEFAASDVLNDPIEELYNTVTNLQDNELRRTTWWLEPAAYFFDFERAGQSIVLTIIETQDLHGGSANNTLLLTIKGTDKEILEPFRIVLRQFCSQSYEENHWPYKLNENKLKSLM
ncbi:hypothetical protein FAZ15_19970 [Sphingobacterium olei]|uniref:Uncharacterized protein n=2 Tax=Sphingobacterium olei TaxID=2571155 RepID=A0A4U0NCT1_9SPHI|nr:hypothetical protein FAZ15_19970 [Sphingobacterium olei]